MDLHMDVVCEEVIDDDGQGADDAAVNTGSSALDIDSALITGDPTGVQAAIVDDGMVDSGDVPKSRKRVRTERKWKKNVRKMKRARGEEYVSTSGKVVAAKIIRLMLIANVL